MGSRAHAVDSAGQLEPFMSARFFLTWGKEMLMFTLTTSRLYNVNVKLHRRVQSHPPGLYTSFIYILKKYCADLPALIFLSIYTLQKRHSGSTS